MSGFKASLFGKFIVERENQQVAGIHAGKVQELFGYLLIFRNHPQPRESLCEVLWGNQPEAKSKKQLRQTLWRLQSALKGSSHSREPEVQADDEWIQINPAADFWLDVAEFEQVFKQASGKPASEWQVSDYALIQAAVRLYKGDLLEGWYQDWCLFERERLQVLYLILLDKLVEYCKIHGRYENGLVYGAEILRHDRASERAHRQMMRLYYIAGYRTQALHQYKRCEAVLRSDLDVEPSELTKQLHEQIRLDNFAPSALRAEGIFSGTAEPVLSLSAMLQRLERFSDELLSIQVRLKKEITALENGLPGPES